MDTSTDTHAHASKRRLWGQVRQVELATAMPKKGTLQTVQPVPSFLGVCQPGRVVCVRVYVCVGVGVSPEHQSSAMLLSVPAALLCMCERVSVIPTYSTTAVSRLLV